MILWTLEAALQSALDCVLVTTDDAEIASVCHGAEIIHRPKALATDKTPSLPVIQHAVKQYGRVDAVMILQPTSPFRTKGDINASIDLFKRRDSLVSVYEGIHPVKSYDGNAKPFFFQQAYDRHKHKCYARNGAIFLLTKGLLDKGRLFNDQPLLYEMPKIRSIDIDSEEDLQIAEALLKEGIVFESPSGGLRGNRQGLV